MLQPGILLCQLIYLTACVSGLAITRDVDQNALLLNTMPTATRVAPSEQIQTHTLVPPTTIPFPTTRTEAPAVTEPPSTTANLQRRQPCCFNEQGFRVDCATWTGYYCKPASFSHTRHSRLNRLTLLQIPGARKATPIKADRSATAIGMVAVEAAG